MAIDANALDRADPLLVARAAAQLEVAVPQLRDAASELLDVVQRTAAGWSGTGHDAWARKVRDLADRTDAAAAALGDLGDAVATVASAAASGQAQLRAAATTATMFGTSVSMADVEWGAARAHYDGILLDARQVFEAVADRVPAAPSVPVVCPPPPPPSQRPWWDDLLFGAVPVVLDDRCQPIRLLEGGNVPKGMLRWVRQIGRADKLDEPLEVLRHRVVTSSSWRHLSDKHATDWFGGDTATKAMKEAFEVVVAKGLRSTNVYNGFVTTREGLVPTLNHLSYDGSKRLLVQVHLEGPLAGQLAAVKIPNQRQFSAAWRALQALK